MIPLPGVRDKGCPLLGAARPGEDGPFGQRPNEDQDHDGGRHPAAGQPTEGEAP